MLYQYIQGKGLIRQDFKVYSQIKLQNQCSEMALMLYIRFHVEFCNSSLICLGTSAEYLKPSCVDVYINDFD